MYGGGFATVPAYLKDMFGTRYVGAIHGLLLTAWSAAGIFGPVLVNYIREYQINHGVPKAQAYNITMYIMAGLLVVGFICNFFDQGRARSLPYEGKRRPRRRAGRGNRTCRGPGIREKRTWQTRTKRARPRCNSCWRGALSASR